MDVLTERSREIPWLLNHAIGARLMLDVGAAGAKYLDALSQVAHKLIAIDTRAFGVPFGVYAVIADASKLPDEWTDRFDIVSCISVLDHVGLDAYGNESNPTTMPKMISEMWRVTVPGGRLLVTAPVGKPQVTTHPAGGQRVFGVEELSALFLMGWKINSHSYWVADGEGYREGKYDEAILADYLGNRAGACMGLELVKL